MGIFGKIDKVLGALGNIKALERMHVDTYTENQITNISGNIFAESVDGQLWIDFQELAGFEFLELVILSKTNIKTFNGGTLIFTETSSSLILESDITEIESDYSNVSNRWMTKVSFVVSKDDIIFIQERKADEIRFEYKKKSISFKVIQ